MAFDGRRLAVTDLLPARRAQPEVLVAQAPDAVAGGRDWSTYGLVAPEPVAGLWFDSGRVMSCGSSLVSGLGDDVSPARRRPAPVAPSVVARRACAPGGGDVWVAGVTADRVLEVWSTRRRGQRFLTANIETASAVTFTENKADGRTYVVAGSRDGTVRLWPLDE
jgi:hypothetical protein